MKVKALCDINQRGLKMAKGDTANVDPMFCNLAGHGMIEILSHDPVGDAPRCVMVSADDADETNQAGDGAGSNGIADGSTGGGANGSTDPPGG